MKEQIKSKKEFQTDSKRAVGFSVALEIGRIPICQTEKRISGAEERLKKVKATLSGRGTQVRALYVMVNEER